MPAWRMLREVYRQDVLDPSRSLVWILLENEPEDLAEFVNVLRVQDSWNISIGLLQAENQYKIPESLLRLTNESQLVKVQVVEPSLDALFKSLLEISHPTWSDKMPTGT
jgi:hypothetical protein